MKSTRLLRSNFTDAQIREFWAKVGRVGDVECWPWLSFRTADGYGKVGRRGAHRVAYAVTHGEIPDGLTIDHLCRNRACCNPAHLEPVTQSVNSKRKYANPDRLYSLTCPAGHPREFGRRDCRRCSVRRVAATFKKYPEKYREVRRLQKRKERERARRRRVTRAANPE